MKAQPALDISQGRNGLAYIASAPIGGEAAKRRLDVSPVDVRR
jgi:hypothetical protein